MVFGDNPWLFPPPREVCYPPLAGEGEGICIIMMVLSRGVMEIVHGHPSSVYGDGVDGEMKLLINASIP